MSQIPDAFKGHDLTGWVYTRGYACNQAFDHLSRLTSDGSVATVYGDLSWVIVACTGQQIEGDEPEIKTPSDLDRVVEKHCGGWAPAPIGYSADPWWQPIETAPKNGEAFIGANAQTGRVSECYWSLFSFRIHSYGSPVELTHWRPKFPPPPEAKP